MDQRKNLFRTIFNFIGGIHHHHHYTSTPTPAKPTHETYLQRAKAILNILWDRSYNMAKGPGLGYTATSNLISNYLDTAIVDLSSNTASKYIVQNYKPNMSYKETIEFVQKAIAIADNPNNLMPALPKDPATNSAVSAKLFLYACCLQPEKVLKITTGTANTIEWCKQIIADINKLTNPNEVYNDLWEEMSEDKDFGASGLVKAVNAISSNFTKPYTKSLSGVSGYYVSTAPNVGQLALLAFAYDPEEFFFCPVATDSTLLKNYFVDLEKAIPPSKAADAYKTFESKIGLWAPHFDCQAVAKCFQDWQAKEGLPQTIFPSNLTSCMFKKPPMYRTYADGQTVVTTYSYKDGRWIANTPYVDPNINRD